MNDRNVNDFSGHINFQDKSPTPRTAVKGQRLASIRFLSLGVAKLMLLSCYGWCFFGAVRKCLFDCYLFLQCKKCTIWPSKTKGSKRFSSEVEVVESLIYSSWTKISPRSDEKQTGAIQSTHIYSIYTIIFIYLYDWYPEPLYHLPMLIPLWRSYISGFSSSAVGRFEGVEKRKTLGIVCTCPITCPNLPNTLSTWQ